MNLEHFLGYIQTDCKREADQMVAEITLSHAALGAQIGGSGTGLHLALGIVTALYPRMIMGGACDAGRRAESRV